MLPTVYSLYWPETLAMVESLWAARPHEWYDRAWERPNERPDLEMVETWRGWSGLDLSAFPNAYCAGGASEAIKDLTCQRLGVHVFEGEYEGYAAYANAFNKPVYKHPRGWLPSRDHDGVLWISDPSAIDGEHWQDLNAWLRELHRVRPNFPVLLDAIYTGVVKNSAQAINPSEHPNIEAVVFSLSKPFGVYRHRVGGVFSRKPILSLEGNRWFNNAFSLELATALMRKYYSTELPNKYAPVQEAAVRNLIARGEIPGTSVPSNAVLLARSTFGPPQYARAPGAYRYCLTPDMHALIFGER